MLITGLNSIFAYTYIIRIGCFRIPVSESNGKNYCEVEERISDLNFIKDLRSWLPGDEWRIMVTGPYVLHLRKYFRKPPTRIEPGLSALEAERWSLLWSSSARIFQRLHVLLYHHNINLRKLLLQEYTNNIIMLCMKLMCLFVRSLTEGKKIHTFTTLSFKSYGLWNFVWT